jgi:hypothetical protein
MSVCRVSSLSKIAGAAPLVFAVLLSTAALITGSQLAAAAEVNDGSILPFAPAPSASVAGETLQDSTMVRRAEPDHLPKDSPNIIIILLDDVGFGLPVAAVMSRQLTITFELNEYVRIRRHPR